MTARRCAPSELLRANVSYYKNQRGVDAGGPRKVKILGPKFDSGASRDLWSEFSGVFGGCRVARDPGCYTSKTKKKTQESAPPEKSQGLRSSQEAERYGCCGPRSKRNSRSDDVQRADRSDGEERPGLALFVGRDNCLRALSAHPFEGSATESRKNALPSPTTPSRKLTNGSWATLFGRLLLAYLKRPVQNRSPLHRRCTGRSGEP